MFPRKMKQLMVGGLIAQLLSVAANATVDSRLYDFEAGTVGNNTVSVADSIALTTIPGSAGAEGFLWLEVAGPTARPLPSGALMTVVNNSALVTPALEAPLGQGLYVDVADGTALDSPAIGSSVALQFDGNTIFDDAVTAPGSRGVLVDAAAFAANDAMVPNVNTFESFSILSQAWVRPNSAGSGSEQVVYQIGNEQGGVTITPDGFWKVSHLGPWYPAPTGEVTSTVPVDFDDWTHVAVFRSGVGGTLYINGREAAGDIPGDQFFNGFAGLITLGGDSFGVTNFSGIVDNLRISGLADQSFDRFTDLTFFDSVDNLIEVNQQTGHVSIRNTGDEPIVFSEYSLTSVNGALDPSAWISISGNYDGGVLDPDNWSITSQLGTDLSEAETPLNDGLTLAAGASIDLGDIWYRSPIRDLAIDLLAPSGSFVDAKVVFVDNSGTEVAPVVVGDLTFEGDINELDWAVFIQRFGADFTGLSVAESYGFGDLDFDGDNDIDDFDIFVDAFDQANGAGAFARMVPEPSGMILVLFGWLAGVVFRRRKVAPGE